MKVLDENGTSYLVGKVKDYTNANYVQKTTTIAGVDLQDNISASELRTALNVESGAQVNAIESVSAGGVALTPDANKNVDIPIAGANLGVVKLANNNYGIHKENDGQLRTAPASDNDIRVKGYEYKPITTTHLDYAVKIGITTNTNTLTSEEKSSAQSWLGVENSTVTLTNDGETLGAFTLNQSTNETIDLGFTFGIARLDG